MPQTWDQASVSLDQPTHETATRADLCPQPPSLMEPKAICRPFTMGKGILIQAGGKEPCVCINVCLLCLPGQAHTIWSLEGKHLAVLGSGVSLLAMGGGQCSKPPGEVKDWMACTAWSLSDHCTDSAVPPHTSAC